MSLAETGTIAEMFADAGIETDVVDASRRGSFLPVVGRLTTLFRRQRPDAVVVFLYEAIVPVQVAAKIARVPAVVTSVRNEYFGPRYRELLLRTTERLSAAAVVNSQRVADSLVARGVSTRTHVVVIYNGIDVSRFHWSDQTRQEMRHSLRVEDDDFVWVAVGRLTEQKAYPNLLRAFTQVAKAVPRSKLLVVGRGPLKGELEDLVRQLRLQGRVDLLGFRNDVPSILAAADAMVIASRYEGMPNAVMEALASGLPVAGTDVGAMPELIAEGVNGYLVPPAEPEALASAMTKIAIASPEKRLAMGEHGRAHVADLCGLGRVMDAWSTLIEQSVRSRAKG